MSLGDLDVGYVWLHFNLADMRACHWIATAQAIPESSRAFILGVSGHQEMRLDGEFINAVVPDIELDFDKPTDRVGKAMVVIGPRFVISGRRAPLDGVHEARALVESGALIPNSVGLLEAIISSATDAMGSAAARMIAELDGIEDRLLEENIGDERHRLGPIRRTLVRVHRRLLGMFDVLREIEKKGTLPAFPRGFGEVHGRLTQRIEALDHEIVSATERARLVHDEVDARLTAETNRNLQTLTLVTILFLPPTLLAGLFGMNLKALPFAESDIGFWWAIVVSIASSAITYWLIRRTRKAAFR